MTTHIERRKLSRRMATPYFSHLAPSQLIELRNLLIAIGFILFIGWLFKV